MIFTASDSFGLTVSDFETLLLDESVTASVVLGSAFAVIGSLFGTSSLPLFTTDEGGVSGFTGCQL